MPVLQDLCHKLGLPEAVVRDPFRNAHLAQQRWQTEAVEVSDGPGPRVVPVLLAPWGDPMAASAFLEACRRRAATALGVVWVVSPTRVPYEHAVTPAVIVQQPSSGHLYAYFAPAAYTTHQLGAAQTHQLLQGELKGLHLKEVWVPGPRVEHGPNGWLCLQPARLVDALAFGAWLLDRRSLPFSPKTGPRKVVIGGTPYIVVGSQSDYPTGWAFTVSAYEEPVYNRLAQAGAVFPRSVDSVLLITVELDQKGQGSIQDIDSPRGFWHETLLRELLNDAETWLVARGAQLVWLNPNDLDSDARASCLPLFSARGYQPEGGLLVLRLGGGRA